MLEYLILKLAVQMNFGLGLRENAQLFSEIALNHTSSTAYKFKLSDILCTHDYKIKCTCHIYGALCPAVLTIHPLFNSLCKNK